MNKLFENACNITATINIEPSTPVDLSEGDVLTVDMFSDADDDALVDLISIVDNVTVEEVTGANSYKINASITDDVAAISLYQWIYANTNVKTDEDMEQYVAPGLAALVNSEAGEAGEAGEASEDPDETTDYDSLADEADMYNESVSSKFAKYRKLYEAAHAELNEAEALNDDKDEDGGGDDDFSDIFGDTDSSDKGDDNGDDKGDDKGDDNTEDNEDDNKDENSDEDSENEDVPMTAVVLTVKKDDADKCKDEMVEAGIAEDDIEIIDSDDEDDENSKIKIDVNSVKELKDYLKGKGIDLEEKIGGEIVDDEDSDSKDDEDSDSKDDDSKDDDKEGKDDEGGEDDFADMDFGDLFGDDEESSDEK